MKIQKKLEVILPLLNHTNAMLAGGSLFSEIQKKFHIPSNSADYDFFFETRTDFERAVKNFQQTPAVEQYKNKTNVLYRYRDLNINLISIYKPHKQTIKDFDMVNSQFWSFYPFTDIQSNFGLNYIEYLTHNLEWNTELNLKLVQRTFKYHTQKYLNIDKYIQPIFNYLTKGSFISKDFEHISYHNSMLGFEGTNTVKNMFLTYLSWLFLNHHTGSQIVYANEKTKMLPLKTAQMEQFSRFINLKTVDYWCGQNRTPEDLFTPDKGYYNSETLPFIQQHYPELML